MAVVQTPELNSNVNINIFELETIKCSNCGSRNFQLISILKKVSALQSPTGKESIVPIDFHACVSCGAIPAEMGGKLYNKLLELDEKREANSDDTSKSEELNG